MSNADKFKTNLDLMQAQSREFTRSGMLLRNVYSISSKHPLLSLVFVLSFGILVNALYDVTTYVTMDSTNIESHELLLHVLIVFLFALLPTWALARLHALHKNFFQDIPLTQKKVLLTLVSKDRSDFKDTPSYNTYEALLYNAGHAAPNALQEIILITSEAPEVQATATSLKTYIEASGRVARICGIAINGKSLLEIQAQIATTIKSLKGSYAPHEILADYTGGTKDMSIALLKESEKELILPIYLKDATTSNHSKYS